MSNFDDDDLPQLPDAPESPGLPSGSVSLDVDESKVGGRSALAGVLLGTVLLGGAGALGYFAYQRDQAYQHRWDAYNQAQAEATDEADFLRRVRAALGATTHQDVRDELIQELGEHRDTEAVPLLIPLLSEAGPIRAQTARSLARIGSPGADAAKSELLRILPLTDVRDRAPVTWALAVMNEPQAADAIIEEFAAGHLQGQPGFDPRIIVNVLGIPRLATLTNHERTGVRTLVAQALSEAATPEVIEPLTVLLRDSDADVKRQAAAGLGRIGDPRAAGPLFAAMQGDAGLRVQVLDALRRSTGARGLGVLLQSAASDGDKRDLAVMIRASHDPAGADALASMLTSEDAVARLEAASGLAELGDARCVPSLLAFARGEDLAQARNALDMLALVRSPEIPAALAPMLEDEAFLARRAGLIKAVAHSGSPEAGRLLERHLDGDDIATAAMGLAELGYEPAYRRLLAMVPRPRNTPFNAHAGMAGVALETAYQNRTAAVRALGRYGRPEAAPALMTIVEDPLDDPRLRNDAGLALGAVADDAVLAEVLQKVQAADLDDAARRYYLGALWQRPSRANSERLMGILGNTALSADVRLPVAVAVGYTADPANDERLIQLLQSPDTDDAAALAISLGGSPAAANALVQRLMSESDLRMGLQEALMNQTNDWFNLLTSDLWESGQVHRRLEVAQILNEGRGDNRFGFAWTTFIARLQAGWGGFHGLSRNDVRQRLYADLTGADEARRTTAIEVLSAMGEMGLLMAARDAGGPGAEDARRHLLELNRTDEDGAEGGAAH